MDWAVSAPDGNAPVRKDTGVRETSPLPPVHLELLLRRLLALRGRLLRRSRRLLARGATLGGRGSGRGFGRSGLLRRSL